MKSLKSLKIKQLHRQAPESSAASQLRVAYDPVKVLGTRGLNEHFIRCLNELLRPSLSKLHLSELSYARVYDDNRAFVLSTNGAIQKFGFQNDVPITASVPEVLVQNSFWYYFPETNPYSAKFHALTQNLKDVKSCANYILRSPGYFEMICFFSPLDSALSPSFFLNKKEELEALVFQFLDSLEDQFKAVSEAPFLLPEHLRPNFKGLTLVSSQPQLAPQNSLLPRLEGIVREVERLHRGSPFELTPRQLDCVRCLLLGKTSTQAAEQLGLSVRTFENYVSTVREKFQVASKADLIEALLRGNPAA